MSGDGGLEIKIGQPVENPIPTRGSPEGRWIGPENERDNLDVYFHQRAFGAMKTHLKEKGSLNETAGLLVGRRFNNQESGRLSNEVEYYLPLPEEMLNASRGRVTITPDAWSYSSRVIDGIFGGNYEIVGWAHSHPGFGLFLSSDDDNVNRFFLADGMIAAQTDPHEGENCPVAIYSRRGGMKEKVFGHGFRFHKGYFFVKEESEEKDKLQSLFLNYNRKDRGQSDENVLRIKPEDLEPEVGFFITKEEIGQLENGSLKVLSIGKTEARVLSLLAGLRRFLKGR